MTQAELKNGQDFHFDNEQWCEQNLSDDLRGGWIAWNDRLIGFQFTLMVRVFTLQKLLTQ